MSSCKEAGRECAKFDHYLIQQKPFDANPDVAGVGVILATRLSAWFSFAVVLFVYVLEPSWKSGIFDMKVLFLIQSIRRRLAGLFFSREHLTRSRPQLDSSSPQRWRFLHGFGACGQTIIDQQLAIGRGFAACVQTISDQQLAIGIGLLLVSYIQHCSMTQYHFGIVYWLAWISFSVHQLAAQVVRLDARHNALSGAWRGALIFCFWPLLGVSNVIIHNDHFLAVLGLSTQCIWADPARISTAAGWIGLLLEQLIIAWATLDALRSYSKRIKRLIELLSKRIGWPFAFLVILLSHLRHCRGQPLEQLHLPRPSWKDTQTIQCRGVVARYITLVAEVVLWIVLILVFAIGGILTSNLATILRVFIILLFANIGIDNLQMAAEKSKAMIGSERDWGFGQILPMLLLILPMLSVVQSLEDSRPNATVRGSSVKQFNGVSTVAPGTSICAVAGQSPLPASVNSSQFQHDIENPLCETENGGMTSVFRRGMDLERQAGVIRQHSSTQTSAQALETRGNDLHTQARLLQAALCDVAGALWLSVALLIALLVYVGFPVRVPQQDTDQ